MALARSAPASTQAVESGGSLSSISRFAVSLLSRVHTEQRVIRGNHSSEQMAGLLLPAKLQQPLTDFVRPPLLSSISLNIPVPVTSPARPQRLAEKLGQGAFGSVYKVRRPGLAPVGGLNSIDRLMLISLCLRVLRRSTVRCMLRTVEDEALKLKRKRIVGTTGETCAVKKVSPVLETTYDSIERSPGTVFRYHGIRWTAHLHRNSYGQIDLSHIPEGDLPEIMVCSRSTYSSRMPPTLSHRACIYSPRSTCSRTCTVRTPPDTSLPKKTRSARTDPFNPSTSSADPNIVQYRGYHRTASSLYIVLEYCENGSLAALVRKFGRIPESLVGLYVLQVLHGLQYLHEQGVIHRDIKGSNILATKEGSIKRALFLFFLA